MIFFESTEKGGSGGTRCSEHLRQSYLRTTVNLAILASAPRDDSGRETSKLCMLVEQLTVVVASARATLIFEYCCDNVMEWE